MSPRCLLLYGLLGSTSHEAVVDLELATQATYEQPSLKMILNSLKVVAMTFVSTAWTCHFATRSLSISFVQGTKVGRHIAPSFVDSR